MCLIICILIINCAAYLFIQKDNFCMNSIIAIAWRNGRGIGFNIAPKMVMDGYISVLQKL